ncbi:MAG: tRNA lysidine(34) synthetase [Bacteroidota bacterium]
MKIRDRVAAYHRLFYGFTILPKMNKDKNRADKLFKKISKKIGKTIREYELIGENDRVLVGLSGGKDSMIMLEGLVNRKKTFPFAFEIFVAHIIPENIGYEVDIQYLEQYCRELGLELILEKIYPEISNEEKSPCFVCSWSRRKALFNLSKNLNCNKIAFGHHRDDALQTFMMNMLYHGSISSMPYKLKMFNGRAELIRPIMDLWEKDLLELAEKRNLISAEKACPHENQTKRNYTMELINKLDSDFPGAKRNMFHALNNIYEEYLPKVKRRSN